MKLYDIINGLYDECQSVAECSALTRRIEKTVNVACIERKKKLQNLSVDEIFNIDLTQFSSIRDAIKEAKENELI